VYEGEPEHDGATIWRQRTRVVLTPVAAPSVLGLFGFAGATLIVAANLAGWYGNSSSGLYLFPFAAMVGGLAQFVAGMWAYRARDAVATAMHGIWGAFWLAFGLLNLLFATHTLTNPGMHFPELGFWFIALGAITASGALAALAESMGLFAVLGCLAAGCGFAAAGYYSGNAHFVHIGGWLFVFSAGFAWYTATAMMLESTYKRVILPLGKYRSETNRPGSHITDAIEYRSGMPGVRVGQ
jgi:succinate-acetate transporter protein